MLRTRFCGSICSNFFRNYKTCARRLESRELQYQCRLMASKSDGGCGKPKDPCGKDGNGNQNDKPDDDTIPLTSDACKGKMGSMKPGRKSLMDTLPKPSIDCKFDEEQRKTRFKKNFTLIAGFLFLSLSLSILTVFGLGFPKKPKEVKVDKQDVKPVKEKKSRRPYIITKNPPTADRIPREVPYLLIGGGTASFSAFRAIKSRDPEAQVLVIGDEPFYPYMRPPLTKELFYTDNREVAKKLKFKQWNGRERSLFYELDDFYSSPQNLMKEEHGGVAVARGYTVTRIDPTKRVAYLNDKVEIKYQKCLIATGAKPKKHPVFEDLDKEVDDKVLLYRNIFNFLELEDVIQSGEAKKIVIVGGSFLGSELACSLARRGKAAGVTVTQIFKESGNMGKVLPEYLSKWTTKKVCNEGVKVMSNTTIEDLEYKDNRLTLVLGSGKEIEADYVVLAIGVTPNTELAEPSGLEIDKDMGGFLVNAELEARSNLFVAGDCACFYDSKLGRRRVEHHDHAVVSGRLAGENMCGAGKAYFHQSMFWSDLGPDVGYEAIGIVDSSLPTVGVYAKLTESSDTPKSVEATEDGMRSTSEEKKEAIGEPNNKKAIAAPEEPKLQPEVPESPPNPIAEPEDGEAKPEDGTPESEDVIAEPEAVAEPEEPEVKPENYGKGVIFYLRDDVVVGIVLWNIFNRMSVARQVLSDNRRYSDLNEVAKLFNIHKD